MASGRDWTQSYEQLKTRIQSKRVQGLLFTSKEIQGISQSISMLDAQLKILASSPLENDLAISEIARRQVLIENMRKMTLNTHDSSNCSKGSNNNHSSSSISSASLSLFGSSRAAGSGGIIGGSGGRATYNPVATSEQGLEQRQGEAIKVQDDLILDIGAGVDRLRHQAQLIGDETKTSMRLLDSLDSDVEVATMALQEEGRHAEKIKDKARVCRMYICIAIEVLVIILLLILAFTR